MKISGRVLESNIKGFHGAKLRLRRMSPEARGPVEGPLRRKAKTDRVRESGTKGSGVFSDRSA